MRGIWGQNGLRGGDQRTAAGSVNLFTLLLQRGKARGTQVTCQDLVATK